MWERECLFPFDHGSLFPAGATCEPFGKWARGDPFLWGKTRRGSDAEIMDSVVDVVNDTMHRGGELKDCVILVRNGKEGAFVADYLIEYNKRENIPFPIPFISNDSLYVSSSPYVELIINVLRYMVEPYDAVNRTVLLYNYRTFVKGEDTSQEDVLFKGR